MLNVQTITNKTSAIVKLSVYTAAAASASSTVPLPPRHATAPCQEAAKQT